MYSLADLFSDGVNGTRGVPFALRRTSLSACWLPWLPRDCITMAPPPPLPPPTPPPFFLPDPGHERAEFLPPPPPPLPLLLLRKLLLVLPLFGAAWALVPGAAGLLCQASSSLFRNDRISLSSCRMRSSFPLLLLLLPPIARGATRPLFPELNEAPSVATSLSLMLDSSPESRPRLPPPLPPLPLPLPPPALARADCSGSDEGRCFIGASQACCCCGLCCDAGWRDSSSWLLTRAGARPSLVGGEGRAAAVVAAATAAADSAAAMDLSSCSSASTQADSLYSGVWGFASGSPSRLAYTGFKGFTCRSVQMECLTVSAWAPGTSPKKFVFRKCRRASIGGFTWGRGLHPGAAPSMSAVVRG